MLKRTSSTLALVGCVVLAGAVSACSSGSGASGTNAGGSSAVTATGAGGASTTAGNTNGAATVGSTTGATSTTTTTSTSTGSTTPMSTPPAGATLCGKAALTAADFLAGCNAAPTAMEQIPSKQCGEVTTTGGRWEAWCDTTGLAYLWVEVDGALPSGSCGASFLSTYSEWEVFAGAGGMSGPLPSGQQKFFTAGPPVNGALDSSVSVTGAQGKGHVWLGANLFCPMGESFPALLGFDFKWAM